MTLIPCPSSSLRVRASFDTQQRLTYNPNAPRNPKKPPNSPPPPPALTLTTRLDPSVFDLLKLPSQDAGVGVISDDTYLGYDVWLPNALKVKKPRSVFNAASLAYIGDCISRHFLFPPLSIEEYNDRVTAVVRCEAQDTLLKKLLDDDYLSAQERDVLRWGKNVGSSKTRTRRRAGAAVYNRASSLETLIGYLYLTNVNRLEKVMLKLGFSTGVSTQMIVEQENSQLTTV